MYTSLWSCWLRNFVTGLVIWVWLVVIVYCILVAWILVSWPLYKSRRPVTFDADEFWFAKSVDSVFEQAHSDPYSWCQNLFILKLSSYLRELVKDWIRSLLRIRSWVRCASKSVRLSWIRYYISGFLTTGGTLLVVPHKVAKHLPSVKLQEPAITSIALQVGVKFSSLLIG